MSCSKILDMVYEQEGELSLYNQLQVWMHTLVCPDCAQEIERYQVCRDILYEDFLSPPDGLEDSIMAKIETEENYAAAPAGLSTRGWVIAGLIILISLATAYFGLDFKRITAETGISFLIPVGITIGSVLTVYGAIFIGTHLKELSERFGL
jgi:hypothetical protein